MATQQEVKQDSPRPFKLSNWLLRCMNQKENTCINYILIFFFHCLSESGNFLWDLKLFHLVTTMFSCSPVSMIKTIVADFSTALYPDFVCCPLPKFKANTPLTVAAMSSCRRPMTRAIVLCQSTPLPTMPGPRKCIVLEHGMERSH